MISTDVIYKHFTEREKSAIVCKEMIQVLMNPDHSQDQDLGQGPVQDLDQLQDRDQNLGKDQDHTRGQSLDQNLHCFKSRFVFTCHTP